MSNEHKHILLKINPTRHPIPSPTTSWSWPCAPSTSCRWRCYPPGTPRTNPTYGRRRGAHRSSRSIPHWPEQKGWWLNQPSQRDSSISIIILLPGWSGKRVKNERSLHQQPGRLDRMGAKGSTWKCRRHKSVRASSTSKWVEKGFGQVRMNP